MDSHLRGFTSEPPHYVLLLHGIQRKRHILTRKLYFLSCIHIVLLSALESRSSSGIQTGLMGMISSLRPAA